MSENPEISINVHSEIGELQGVIIHTPGSEVENMTPENAERALYSDILNLPVAKEEYYQFREVLKRLTRVYEVRDLLVKVLESEQARREIITKVLINCIDPKVPAYLESLDNISLAGKLIEGIPLSRDSLSRFLNPQRFAVRPLHNFFFTRDASVSMYEKVLISKMASPVRERESQIMETIFNYHPGFNTTTFNARQDNNVCRKVSIEGGDVLIGRDDLLLIGIGSRTTPDGVDVIIDRLKEKKSKHHIIIQELPTKGESFIHLDMVFTFLNVNECMVYEPVILHPNRYKTLHVEIDNGNVKISEEKNILDSLSKLGLDMKPIYCGGSHDLWTQEREQWHSGANFLAVSPGKVISYGRNQYTIEELNHNGYDVIDALDVMSGRVDINNYKKCVITIEGSELARGGGGARCMSMPISRKPVQWA